MSLPLYEIENAPTEAIAEELRKSEKAFGFVPNLHKALAASHQALVTYKSLHTAFQSTRFNNTELTVIWQTINTFHNCHYCVPAHTAIAHMLNVDGDVIKALQHSETLTDPKLAALQATTREITEARGHLSAETKKSFLEAGYSEAHLVEIVLGLSQKVLSNYINHLAQTPVDPQFAEFVN